MKTRAKLLKLRLAYDNQELCPTRDLQFFFRIFRTVPVIWNPLAGNHSLNAHFQG